jgi:hypothetical protein
MEREPKPATRSRLLGGSVGLRRALHHWLVAWLLVWILDTAQAQVRFDTWTTEEGLPQNSVLALAQSRDGYLWMATYNGLVRFDGVRFTLFDKRNTPAFPTSRFQDIKEDAAGALWITFFEEEAGLVRYKDGQFTAFGRTNGLPANTIYHAHVAPDGALLLSTDQGIFWWRNERFEPYERSGSARLRPGLRHAVRDPLVRGQGRRARNPGQRTCRGLRDSGSSRDPLPLETAGGPIRGAVGGAAARQRGLPVEGWAGGRFLPESRASGAGDRQQDPRDPGRQPLVRHAGR